MTSVHNTHALSPGEHRGSTPRLLVVLLAACATAMTLPSLASANINSVSVAPRNPTAGSPVAITTVGTADNASNSLTILYAPNSACIETGLVVIATHQPLGQGSFAFTDHFTPPAAGPYCIFTKLSGSGPGTSHGNAENNQSIIVAAAPPSPAQTTAGVPGGARSPGSTGSTNPTGGQTGATQGSQELASSLRLTRNGSAPLADRGLTLSLHLLSRATARTELLLGTGLAHRLHVRGAPDAVTHGRYVVLAQTTLANLQPGTVRQHISLSHAAASRLTHAGPVEFAVRASLHGPDRRFQVLVVHTTITT